MMIIEVGKDSDNHDLTASEQRTPRRLSPLHDGHGRDHWIRHTRNWVDACGVWSSHKAKQLMNESSRIRPLSGDDTIEGMTPEAN